MLSEIIELQNNAVSKLVSLTETSGKKSLTFRAPTGSGKTYMMADYINRLLCADSEYVFLVSSLSKSDLAEQNYEKFCEYREYNNFNKINPLLISSEISGEERLYIPTDYNVYLLPQGLYKEKARLMAGPFVLFLTELKLVKNKKIIWVKDECHIATNNLDELAPRFFDLTVNFSATPKLKRGQFPDVEITDEQAESCNLIKRVIWNSEDDSTVEDALATFKNIKKDYRDLLGVNPCLIIQISNKEKADEELYKQIFPALNDNPELKWMLIVQDPKQCDTNDFFKAKKLPVAQWKKYAKGNLSGIDVIIFKLVISEGWDIPRACMLYQTRDSRSKQLDEQVVGRVRRNPRLMDFETLSPRAQQLAMTAWVWGVKKEEKGKVYSVKLQDSPGDITENIKIKTTRLKPLDEKIGFDLKKFIESQPARVTHKSIFEINRQLNKIDSSVKKLIYDYADTYSKWWDSAEYASEIAKESNQYRCDYTQSMEMDKEVSFSPESSYTVTDKYVNIDNWIWKRNDGAEKFSFDSEAERDWAETLKDLASKGCELIVTGKKDSEMLPEQLGFNGETQSGIIDPKEVFLWGKNFLHNSQIKYEYYQDALHTSFPDFIMKDKKGRIHIFEVKSVNQSSSLNIDTESYEEKIRALKNCYKQASIITGHYFYLPILSNDDWQITVFYNGEEKTVSKKEFRKNICN